MEDYKPTSPHYTVTHRTRIGAVVALMLTVLALTASSTEIAAQTSRWETVVERGILVAGIRRDNPPHSFINGSGEWVGFDVDIAHALAHHMGVRLKRVPVDELTRISYLQTGKIDVAIASMSHTHKRDRQIDFSQTYFRSSQSFLVRKGEISSLVELVGKSVGMDRGSHAISNWKAWCTKNALPYNADMVHEFTNKQSAVQAVRSGAISGYAEDYELLAAFAKKYPELMVLDAAIGMKQDGIGIRENDSRMRDQINFGLQRIETTGEYDTIYNRWFGPDTDTPVPLRQRIEVWPNG